MADELPRVVVLRFVSGIRVDLVSGMSEAEAIADFTARTLRAGTAELPLIEAFTAEVPIGKLREFAAKAEPTLVPPERPNVSVAGLCRAVRVYMEAVAASREQSAHETARSDLGYFFNHYGVELDFRIAAPREAAKA